MSFVAHGLKCDSCEERDPHVFYKRADGPPPCPDCGGDRVVDWSHGKFPGVQGDGYGSFKTIDMGHLGVCETREQSKNATQVRNFTSEATIRQLEHCSQMRRGIVFGISANEKA